METTLSVINLMPSNKAQISVFKSTLKAEILANDKDPLPILVQMKMAEKTIKEVLSDNDLDDHFLTEFLKYDKKEKVVVSGATLTSSETGVKYFFDDCGDQIYNDLIEESEKIKEKIKEREAYLKALPEEGTVCPIHGNFLTRPSKSSKTKVIVRL